MPAPALLTVLKLLLLALLYLFLFRAVRAVVADLYGPSRRQKPPPRPAVVASSDNRKTRRLPRELVLHPPDGRPRVVTLGSDSVTLGRGQEVSVRLDDVYVSDLHAEISRGDDGWTVRDLGSTNGTFLNGAKVTQPAPLSAGDQLRVGKTRVEVRR